MGFWQSFFNLFNPKKKVTIIVVGQDNSGKTTIINNLRDQKNVEVTPTIGYNVEKMTKNNFNFTIFDMSGVDTHRDLWETHYKDVDGVIFVVDAADEMRYNIASHEFDQQLQHKDIKPRKIPILLFQNKIDQKNACTAQDCLEFMNLHAVKGKTWNIQMSDAIKGSGLEEGMTWLMERLK